jgi:hypothetical protein
MSDTSPTSTAGRSAAAADMDSRCSEFLRSRLGTNQDPDGSFMSGSAPDGPTPETYTPGLGGDGFSKEYLMKETGLNVHDEKVAATLEDPVLIEHMRNARERAEAAIAEHGNLNEAEVRTAFTTQLGKLSHLMGMLLRPLQDMDTSASEVLISSRHIPAAMLGVGKPPHFDKVALNSDMSKLADVKRLAEATGSHLQKHGKALTELIDGYRDMVRDILSCHQQLSNAYYRLTKVLHAKNEKLAAQHDAITARQALVDHEAAAEEELRRKILSKRTTAP